MIQFRLIFAGLLVIVLSGILSSAAVAENDPDLAKVYYESGLMLVKQSKYAEAADKFTQALSNCAVYPEALFKLGECREKTRDTTRAIRNYRLCLKQLISLANPTKEQYNLVTEATGRLDKIDLNTKELNRIKSNYIEELLKFARYCLGRKYYRFTRRLLERVLMIDPFNKAALEMLTKVPADVKPVADKPLRESPEQKLFNGKDINNWESMRDNDRWKVKDGNIIVDADEMADVLVWKGKAPATFVVKVSVSISEVRNDDQYPIAIAYSRQDRRFMSAQIFTERLLTRKTVEVELTVKKGRGILKIDGKLIDNNIDIQNIGTPVVGVITKNVKASISNIVIRELK